MEESEDQKAIQTVPSLDAQRKGDLPVILGMEKEKQPSEADLRLDHARHTRDSLRLIKTNAEDRLQAATESINNETTPVGKTERRAKKATVFPEDDADTDSKADEDSIQKALTKKLSMLDPEGLGKNYESTPYALPNKVKAKEYAVDNKFLGGNAKFFKTSINELGSMGVGVALYFLFLKYFAIMFSIMAVVTIPTLVLYVNGNGLAQDSYGPLGITTTTIANLGTGNSLGLIKTEKGPTASIFGEGIQLTRKEAAYLISFLDFVGSILFFIFILFVRQRVLTFIRKIDDKYVSAADYAVMVTGLPEDATADEVRDHFDGLYQLKNPDWTWPGQCFGCIGKKKERATGIAENGIPLEPIQNWEHSPDEHSNSWCAEVCLAYKDGAYLQLFMRLRAHNRKLRAARARVKKCTYMQQKAIEAHGDNSREAQRWSRSILKARHRLGKVEDTFEKLQKNLEKMKKRKGASKQHACQAAFVLLEHEESYLRCIDDYVYQARWWRPQPSPLRFRGEHVLKVVQAPEPSNVIWENLDVGKKSRFLRRSLNNAVTFVLLMISLILIFAAQKYKEDASQEGMDFSLCSADLPSLFFSRDMERTNELVLHRERDLDQMCPGNNSHWLTYAFEVNELNGEIEPILDHQSIPVSPQGEFNLTGYHTCHSPCVALNPVLDITATGEYLSSPSASAAQDVCWTTAYDTCTPTGPLDQSCEEASLAGTGLYNITTVLQGIAHGTTLSPTSSPTPTIPWSNATANVTVTSNNEQEEERRSCCKRFDPNTILIGCYCLQATTRSLERRGLVRGIQFLMDTESDLCGTFAESFVLAQALLVAAVLVVLVVNVLLKVSLTVLGHFERHHTVSQQAASITWKIFLAQFMNTAVVVLVVNAKLPDSIDNPLSAFRLLEGNHPDLTRDWYSSVGIAILLTMLLNSVVPHLGPLFRALIVQPLQRKLFARRVTTQQELNKMFAGDPFDITLRFPLILNTIFVALFYGGPMPILWTIAAVSLGFFFFVDKYVLLYLARKPPQYDHTLVEMAIQLLPFGLMMHFGISFWAYGNPELVESSDLDLAWFSNITGGGLGSDDIQSFDDNANLLQEGDPIGFFRKANRLVSLPHLLLGVLFLAFFIADAVAGIVVRRLLLKLFNMLTFGFFNRTSGRRFNSPYTGEFSLLQSGKAKISYNELKEGWRMEEHVGKQHKKRVWLEDGEIDGISHKKGEYMKTWEVIRDSALHTYRIEANPKYTEAIQASVEVDKSDARLRRENTKRIAKSKIAPAPAYDETKVNENDGILPTPSPDHEKTPVNKDDVQR